ncbi:DMT family transporter [Leeia oryzae]|uniref:DMT family transporter n=1 Tax=Leeia oryzae TaxID=356662 RepID=UPI00036CA6EC|nr:DMT family transporter [Leeia oryzae]
MEKQQRGAVIELIIAMCLSGTIGWFVTESRQPVWNVVFARCVVGSLGLAAYISLTGLWRAWHFNARSLLWCIAGGLALVANWLLLFNAYLYSSIGLATVVYHTQPFWLLLLGVLLLGEKLTRQKLLALALAFAGLLLIVLPDTHMALKNWQLGSLLALGAAILYAVTTIITKQLPKDLPPHLIALVQTLVGAVLLFPMLDSGSALQIGNHWYYLAILGLVHTTGMYILMYAAFRKLPTHLIGVIGFIYPVVAMLVDYVAYGRVLGWLQLAGMVLIIGSNAFVLNRAK